ncbi:MAG: NrdH-redoxin [Dethiosulfovibrio peptidovorans]|nr:MAG: NrdH-redoxin [Dethiosulfovibrio peptidovorans]
MTVTVYSTSTCIWCKKVKQYLTDKGVEFNSIDVGANREAGKKMIAETGQMGVPVIDIDGRYIVGFDKTALDEALGL